MILMGKKILSRDFIPPIPYKFGCTTIPGSHFVMYQVTRDTRVIYSCNPGILSLHLTTSSLLIALSQAKSLGHISMNTLLSDCLSLHPPNLGQPTNSISMWQLSTHINIFWNEKKGGIHTTVMPPLSFFETW